jgi:hypothetical protein
MRNAIEMKVPDAADSQKVTIEQNLSRCFQTVAFGT